MPITLLSDVRSLNDYIVPNDLITPDELIPMIPQIATRGRDRYVLSHGEELFKLLFPHFRNGINIDSIAEYTRRCFGHAISQPFGLTMCTTSTEFDTMLNEFLDSPIGNQTNIVYIRDHQVSRDSFMGYTPMRTVITEIVARLSGNFEKYNIAFTDNGWIVALH